MALDYNNLSDFDLDNFTGVIPKADGAVELEAHNYVPEQFLRTLGVDGAATGWSKVEGPTSGGFHAYLLEISGAVRTGGKQTSTPDTVEQASHLFNKPLVSGGLAPSASTPGVAIPAQPLEAPVVTKVATGISGLPQGEYLAAISLMTASGGHTLLTNPVQITISTDGKLVEFKLLLDADRTTVSNQGLWLSEPVALGGTPDPLKLRLQAVAPNSGRTFVVKGPYNYSGRLAPTKNETEIGIPPTMIQGTDFKGVHNQVKWIAPGQYIFYIVQSTTLGDSLASLPTPPIGRRVASTLGVKFTPALHPSAVGYKIFWQDLWEGTAPAMYQLVRTQGGDRSKYFTADENVTFFANMDDGGGTIAPNPGAKYGTWRNFTASATTDFLTVTVGKFTNGQEVRVQGGPPAPLKGGRSYWVRDASGSSFKLAGTKNGAAINIQSEADMSGQVATYEFVTPPVSYMTVSVSGDPPTEDTSGVPNPTGEIDPPTVVGLGIPEAGTYLVGYTRLLSGRETPISETVQIVLSSGDVAAGMVIKMDYPPRVNKIPNALYGQVDQKGLPLNWDIRNSTNVLITAPDANHALESAGVLALNCSGSLANTGRYPNAQTKAGLEIALDRGRIETIAGWLAVASRTSGSAYIEVVQLNGSKVEVGSRLTLATLAANGAVEFKKTIGDASLTPDLSLHAEAVYAIIQWGAEGNPRQLKVKAYSQIWSPQRGTPRRYYAPAQATDAWVGTNDPSAPWPSSHLLAIGQPPATAASAAALASSSTTTAVQSDYIEGTTFDSGTIPAGWTTHRSPVDANTEIAVITAAAIEGPYGLRSRDGLTTADADVFIDKPFAVATVGDKIAMRFLVRLTALPTAALSYYQIAGITSSDPSQADPIGLVIYHSSTRPYIKVYRWHFGGWFDEYLIFFPTNGTVLDVELRVSGLTTANGRVEVWIGTGGAARTLRWSASGVDYTNAIFSTVYPWLGPQSGMGYPAGTATLDFDSLHITKTGYTGVATTVVNAAPALTPLVQPDWPWNTATPLSGPSSSPVDHTDTSTSGASRAVAATFNRTGAVAAERTLAQIRNSAGTEVVGLYMKTDHTVELRKGATPYAAATAVPTGTDYRFGIIVTGAGTANGMVMVYRTIGTGARELIVFVPNQDFSATLAQRATVANNAELTETNIVVTAAGEYTYDSAGPDGQPINQGYVAILPADVTNQDVGFVVEEFVVRPNEERTNAVFMRAEDLPASAAPFTVVAYDAVGRSVELGSAYADGTAVANAAPGWYEYWLTYTPPEDYSRIRIEHRGMTGGRYVFQKPLDAPGNLNSTALRAAARDDRRALEGTYYVILNARVPGQSTTMVGSDYREERTDLAVDAETPREEVGDVFTVTADASTDVLTLSATHRYVTDSRVRLLTTTTLPAPLTIDTTYYVRDVTATTLKLSATEGGAAINITSTGTGTHSLYGYTAVSARWRSADSEEALSGLTWKADAADVPDLEWIEAEVTMEGDGTKTPVIDTGSPSVVYQPWMPMLLRSDGTPLYGGVYIGGGGQANNLFRPFSRSPYDTETVADRAAPRALSDAIGRLHGFTLNIFTPEALDYIYSNAFLDEEHLISSPFHDVLMRVQFYDPPDEPSAMFDFEGFDEARPFAVSQMMPYVVTVERAEVLEVAPLSGEAPGATDEEL